MQLITYLTFAGNCEEAINFYKEALGGKIIQLSHMGDGPMEVPEHLKGKVMHSRLQLGESVLYMSDNFDPASIHQGNNVHLSLQIDDATELEKLFTNLSAGGWVAGQGQSLGADAGRVAQPPRRLPRRGDSLQGVTGGGAMK